MKDIPKALNPKTTHLEFSGKWGCLSCILMMPITTAALYLFCLDKSTLCSISLTLPVFKPLEFVSALAFAWYCGWFLFQLAAYALVPGQWTLGVELRNGSRLSYKINAFRVLVLTHVALAYSVYNGRGIESLIWIADHAHQLAFAAFVVAALLAVVVYISSFRSSSVMLSTVGNAGVIAHDFWMGRELNPRIGLLDVKYFCELRPGMMLWAILNYAYAAKQYSDLGYITNSMIFVCLGQLVYIADSVWFEKAILTTMDITTDGFGVGDLLWVPFTFTMQARYLSMSPQDLSNTYLMMLVVMSISSYITFRASNSQKNAFRTNPEAKSVSHLQYINTDSGSRLLITGWWGVSRHINYLGDWCMGLSWCMATGLHSPIPYFYVIYFAILLLHRAHRDDIKCREKYGKDWEKYCKIVKWQIIPFIL